MNKSFVPSGGNDEKLVLGVAVERDEAAMIVSVEVVVGKISLLQLVDDSTSDDTWSISFQLGLACSYWRSCLTRFFKDFVVGQAPLSPVVEVAVVVDDRGPPASDAEIVLLVTTLLDWRGVMTNHRLGTPLAGGSTGLRW